MPFRKEENLYNCNSKKEAKLENLQVLNEVMVYIAK